jgi:hypothetical protein
MPHRASDRYRVKAVASADIDVCAEPSWVQRVRRRRSPRGQLRQIGLVCFSVTGLKSPGPGAGLQLAYGLPTSSGAATKNSSAGI